MGLRNLPVDEARALSSLVNCRPGQIASKALSSTPGVDMTLLSFSSGESVSNEEYFGDTLYYVVSGAATIVLPDKRIDMHEGDVLEVNAHVLHAVESASDLKLLQITLVDDEA